MAAIQNADKNTAKSTPTYKEALIGLNGFSYLNILWWFSGCDNEADRSALSEEKHWPNKVEDSGDFDWESEFNF